MTPFQLAEYRRLIDEHHMRLRDELIARQNVREFPDNELMKFMHHDAKVKLQNVNVRLQSHIDEHIDINELPVQHEIAI